MADNPLTLKDYCKDILRTLRPLVLKSLQAGQFDDILKNDEERERVLLTYSDDLDILIAILERLKVINGKSNGWS